MTEINDIKRLAGMQISESAEMPIETLIKISEEGIEDCKTKMEEFRQKGDDESVAFCNRMIYRLYHLTQTLKAKTGE